MLNGGYEFCVTGHIPLLVQSQLWPGLLHKTLTLQSLNIASLMESNGNFCPLRQLDPGKIRFSAQYVGCPEGEREGKERKKKGKGENQAPLTQPHCRDFDTYRGTESEHNLL